MTAKTYSCPSCGREGASKVLQSIHRVMTGVAVGTCVLWILSSATTVGPQMRESWNAYCLVLLIVWISTASIAGVLHGVIKSMTTVAKRAKWKRVVLRVVFYALLPLGVDLLSVGHAYYVRAKERESHMQEILERDHCYHNPYWDLKGWYELFGWTSLGGFALWSWLMLLSALSCGISKQYVGGHGVPALSGQRRNDREDLQMPELRAGSDGERHRSRPLHRGNG